MGTLHQRVFYVEVMDIIYNVEGVQAARTSSSRKRTGPRRPTLAATPRAAATEYRVPGVALLRRVGRYRTDTDYAPCPAN